MRVLVIENYRSTPLGQLSRALDEGGADVHLVRAFDGEPLPATDAGYDGLVILGGEQTALDDEDYPYLPALAGLGRRFGDAGKAVLGICLGAQIVARGYGAENILGRPLEFGWHPVAPTEAGRQDPVMAVLEAPTPIFHWHTDTFSLPPGAVHLASSDRTAIQAFRVGRAVYGIQFHFEADRTVVSEWNDAFATEIAAFAPDWAGRHAGEAERHGAGADALGMALARRWVGLI
ncbi:MAG: type 1 glutamine amidotransferase [Bauldia sp.]|nr:type 1 glutamine amidotransferase [Bauldia sp.]